MRPNFRKIPEPKVAPCVSAAQTQSLFRRALAHHKQGELSQAQTLYTDILKTQPRHADTLHFLWVIAVPTGDPQKAVELIERAIAIKPDDAQAYCNRGLALKALKQLDVAVASYDKAITIKPDYAEAYYNLGNALKELKQFDAAVASYDKPESVI